MTLATKVPWPTAKRENTKQLENDDVQPKIALTVHLTLVVGPIGDFFDVFKIWMILRQASVENGHADAFSSETQLP